MFSENSQETVFQACRVIFGEEARITPQFLSYLQLSGIKAAFRKQAKELHPDLFQAAGLRVVQQKAMDFHRLRESFDILLGYLKERRSVAFIPSRGGFSASASTQSSHLAVSESSKSEKHYYTGPVPEVALEFGSFLFYRGLISSQDLFDALRWQRKQRPSIGETARRWGWLNETQIHSALNLREGSGRFGEKCVRLGLLTESQVRTLVYFQRTRQKRLGEYFVEKGFLTLLQVGRLLGDLHFHNSRVKQRAAGGPHFF